MIKTNSASDIKLCWWPSPQDYNEAVQCLQANFSDEELKSGMVYLDAIGLPRPVTGSFASVYRVKCRKRDVALRCFLHNIADQEERYSLISNFVQTDNLPYTVTFQFLSQGIKLGGSWFPALKMEWVEGEPLDQYILRHLSNPKKLEKLSVRFLKMMADLGSARIAHGDLQHGNIIVLENGELRLVDYDGMFVPAMQTRESRELGHRNYQHPLRTSKDFGPNLDNFSAWIIYASLVGLQVDSRLWYQLASGDDCLLFRHADFCSPEQSPSFAALENHTNERLRRMGRFIRSQLAKTPGEIPTLKEHPPDIAFAALARDVSPVRNGPRLIDASSPEWLSAQNVQALKAKGIETEVKSFAEIAKSHPVPWIKPSGASGAGAVPSAKTQTSLNKQVHQIEPQLLQATPRNTRYNQKSEIASPRALQICMIFNPIVWMLIFYFSQFVGPDQELIHHGQSYTANITSIRPYDYKGQHLLTVNYTYEVKGKNYSDSVDLSGELQQKLEHDRVMSIYTSPNNPGHSEGPSDSLGKRADRDGVASILLLLISIVCEFLVWAPAWRHKSFAKSGIPVSGQVLSKTVQENQRGDKCYRMQVSYRTQNAQRVYVKMVYLSSTEFCRFTEGQQVTVLYDRRDARSMVVYDLCRYIAC